MPANPTAAATIPPTTTGVLRDEDEVVEADALAAAEDTAAFPNAADLVDVKVSVWKSKGVADVAKVVVGVVSVGVVDVVDNNEVVVVVGVVDVDVDVDVDVVVTAASVGVREELVETVVSTGTTTEVVVSKPVKVMRGVVVVMSKGLEKENS